jgi:selenide,water dikinase
MVSRSEVGAEVSAADVPVLRGALMAARDGFLCGGLVRNRAYWEGTGRMIVDIQFDAAVPDDLRAVLWDPQTSGGLLLSVAPGQADQLVESFTSAGEPIWRVGRITAGSGIRVTA